MGSQPQSQDVEHQASPEVDDLRIRREALRDSSLEQRWHQARQRSHPKQGENVAKQRGPPPVG